MADHNGPDLEQPDSSGDSIAIPQEDAPLLDLLDALVNERVRVAAAEALRVSYLTMAASHEFRSDRVSQHHRSDHERRSRHPPGQD